MFVSLSLFQEKMMDTNFQVPLIPDSYQANYPSATLAKCAYDVDHEALTDLCDEEDGEAGSRPPHPLGQRHAYFNPPGFY